MGLICFLNKNVFLRYKRIVHKLMYSFTIRLLLCSLLLGRVLFAQEQGVKIPDSLSEKSKDELIMSLNETSDRSKKEIYAKALIAKAKAQKDTLYLITGYHIATILYKDEKKLMYCDSIISLTRNSNDLQYPAIAYLVKGSHYYDKRDFKNALDNYISANLYAKKNNNETIVFQSNYAIGILKDRIGESNEAIKLHRDNFAYVKKNFQKVEEKDYLNSIFALANTFNDLKSLDSATFYNTYGIRESIRLKDQRKYNHFVLSAAVTNYYQKNYPAALDSIKKSIPYFEKIDDKPNMAVGYYYMGKTYLQLDRDKDAMYYFKKVDTVFQQNKDVLPRTRDSYEILIDYYSNKNDLKQQLNYIRQLMKLDSVLHGNEIYLNKNIIKQYDIPRLISEKESIISKLKRKEYWSNLVIIVILAALLAAIILSFNQYKNKRLYKKRFENLINQKDIERKTKKGRRRQKGIGVSVEIVDSILSNLERFEKEQEYLDPDINTHSLAKKTNTNVKYLSKVINHHKNMSFTNYINHLRIQHTINELKTDPMYRKFTIKAIAAEFGFNNPESFSQAFYKNTGIKPSYFIKELQNIS